MVSPVSTDELSGLAEAADINMQLDDFIDRMCARAKADDATLQCWTQAISKPVLNGRHIRHISSYVTLASIMLTLPSTSVENERQFSLMNLVKDKRHHRMGHGMLNDLCAL